MAYLTKADFSTTVFQFLGQPVALMEPSLSMAQKCQAPSPTQPSLPELMLNMSALGEVSLEGDEKRRLQISHPQAPKQLMLWLHAICGLWTCSLLLCAKALVLPRLILYLTVPFWVLGERHSPFRNKKISQSIKFGTTRKRF